MCALLSDCYCRNEILNARLSYPVRAWRRGCCWVEKNPVSGNFYMNAFLPWQPSLAALLD